MKLISTEGEGEDGEKTFIVFIDFITEKCPFQFLIQQNLLKSVY
jgi:hypothetical protein